MLAALASSPATKALDPDPFPRHSLRHPVYAALLHFGFETAGEKKEEKEEKGKDYVLSERRWGSFQRSFRVPTSIDEEKIEATFSNGVLTIVLPKSAEAQQAEKTIDIKRV